MVTNERPLVKWRQTCPVRSAVEIAEAVRLGQLRAVDVLDEAQLVIERRNGELVAFVHLDWELASREAQRVDGLVAQGRPVGPLAGVPFGVKDLDDCAGMPTSHGSLLFKNSQAATDSFFMSNRPTCRR